jgi:phage terminase large subunit
MLWTATHKQKGQKSQKVKFLNQDKNIITQDLCEKIISQKLKMNLTGSSECVGTLSN